MHVCLALLSLTIGASATKYGYSATCQAINPMAFELVKAYCEQPIFVSFLPKTAENQLLDNVCWTYFPLPDDPDTFQHYVSRVYCDGSNDVMSFVETSISLGTNRKANPYLTVTDFVVGYAGCDTYIMYRCPNYGEYYSYVFGLSYTCKTIGLSCLRKVEEVISEHCLPSDDFYILPMKLPNRCVTQQLCITPPNPFYGHLTGSGIPRAEILL